MTLDRPPIELVPQPQQTDVDRFLERHADSPNTFAAYTVDLRQFARFTRPTNPQLLDWTRVQIADVEAWDRWLRAGGASAATRHRKLAALSSMLVFRLGRAAPIVRKIGLMRAALLPDLAGRSTSIVLLDVDQLRRLRDAPRAVQSFRPMAPAFMLRDVALLTVLAELGVRPTEACDLRVGDYVPDVDVLRIATGDKIAHRSIKMSAGTRDAVDRYVRQGRPVFGGASDAGPDPDSPLFTNQHGRKLTRQGVWLIVKRHAEAAGVPLAPGVLRRSLAAEKRRQGWSIEQIAAFFGVEPDGQSPVLTA